MRLMLRSSAALALAVAAIAAGLASPAAAAPAGAQAAAVTYTQTSLNLGLRLTNSNAGTVVASKPASGDARQRWVEPGRTVYVNGAAKSGYELRPADNSAYCVTDQGVNQRVTLTSCGSLATQVWQWVPGRSVNGKSYMFWVNAQTGGKLMFDTFTSEGSYPSFTVISSGTKYTPGTAGEACQLWFESQ
ncbi:hypothetical protein [Dactylosporangium matsuzakiense]|uniref:Ricin-type beta-trefoil lectin protein n=1 Tax=Dactylosporangium matsuzakiense TaxID=53360 RepID=A0A9W6KJD4_9ACTN|nr:hypothetical protein [Dactylosporangium matsuzakiense]GLL02283.1 hypothetical protein GCM10017581_040250 [Dactylosporangium matsuzakiense]